MKKGMEMTKLGEYKASQRSNIINKGTPNQSVKDTLMVNKVSSRVSLPIMATFESKSQDFTFKNKVEIMQNFVLTFFMVMKSMEEMNPACMYLYLKIMQEFKCLADLISTVKSSKFPQS